MSAGLHFERNDVGIGRGDEHFVPVERSATIADVAAHVFAGVFRQLMVVLPDHRTSPGVYGEGAAVGRGDIHHAVVDQWCGVLRVEHAEGKRPLRNQALDGLGVDLIQGTEARAHVVAPDHAPIVEFLVRVDQHVVGDTLREPLIRSKRERNCQQSSGSTTEKIVRYSEHHDLSPFVRMQS